MLVESTVKPNPIEITATRIFINTDIKEVERENDGESQVFFVFNQENYDKDDYLTSLLSRTELLEDALQDLILNIG